jgi:hypothetical protein
MIKHLFGATLTPNQAAKLIIADLGIHNFWNWRERSIFCDETTGDKTKMTESEAAAIDKACAKQAERVHQFLGLSTITRRCASHRD